MINRDTRDFLLGLIVKNMIPEYEKSEKLKDEIRETYLGCIDKCLTDDEKRIIQEHPEFIKRKGVVWIYPPYTPPKDIKICYKRDDYGDREGALKIKLPDDTLQLCDYLTSLNESYPMIWRKLVPKIQSYCCVRNAYIEKWNIAYDALIHKNVTITKIKNEFPELYKLYRENLKKE